MTLKNRSIEINFFSKLLLKAIKTTSYANYRVIKKIFAMIPAANSTYIFHLTSIFLVILMATLSSII